MTSRTSHTSLCAAVAVTVVAVLGVTLPSAPAAHGAPTISGKYLDGSPFTLPPPGSPPYPQVSSSGLPGAQPLRTAVDAVEPYVAQASCDPVEKPGVTTFKRVVMSTYPQGSDWGTVRNCSDDGVSEHLEGRAWDWHVDVNNPAQFDAAAHVLTWLTANNGVNARRLGVMYIGYNHRIWGAYRAGDGWRTLNNSNPHTDHVHFSFTWNGATAATSYYTGARTATDFGPCRPYRGQPAPLWTGRNPKECPSPPALPSELDSAGLLWRGTSSPTVVNVQQKLGVTPTSGFFGTLTANAVAAFQRRAGLPVTAAVDARTWFALGLNTPLVKPQRKRALKPKMQGTDVQALQRKLKIAPKHRTGYFGSITKRHVIAWKKRHRMTPTPVATKKMLVRLKLW